MPTNDRGVREVTAPVQLAIVDDRLHVTFISGPCERTYSLSFHKARGSIHAAMRLLEQHEAEKRVVPLRKRK